jgi:RHS repeat-associated protein
MQYASHGPLKYAAFANGVTETWSFDPIRQQPWDIKTSGNPALLELRYDYCPNNSYNIAGPMSCSTNNGNVENAQILTSDGLNLFQSFSYDAINRLSSAAESGGANEWSQTYTIDFAGNRAVSSGTLFDPNWTPTSLTQFNSRNQWVRGSGDGYDGAGNQTSIASNAAPNIASGLFSFDAENRIISANAFNAGTTNYAYDAEGRRVTKTVSGVPTTTYVYDAAGQLAAEYGGPANAVTGTQYLSVDMLGSTRLVTGSNGVPQRRTDYLPFGEEIPAGYGGRSSNTYSAGVYPSSPDFNPKFTSKERDSETGLDWFNTRYFSGAQGRFTSPDAPFNDQQSSDPQSWNLYAYSRNNPLRFTDPTGQYCVSGGDNVYYDDDKGGQTCAEAFDPKNNDQPSVTVVGNRDGSTSGFDQSGSKVHQTNY